MELNFEIYFLNLVAIQTLKMSISLFFNYLIIQVHVVKVWLNTEIFYDPGPGCSKINYSRQEGIRLWCIKKQLNVQQILLNSLSLKEAKLNAINEDDLPFNLLDLPRALLRRLRGFRYWRTLIEILSKSASSGQLHTSKKINTCITYQGN